MTKWFIRNKTALIRNSFLVPILLVVIMSISHVVSWYELGNPISWAIYLSVAIEIFALASVSASTLKVSKGAIWFLFSLVTLIQIIGNIFFEYTFINVEGEGFKNWLELISPIVDDWGVLEHKRLLAIVQGGTLPIMSLTALHFFIQFNEEKSEVKEEKEVEEKTSDPIFTKEEISENLELQREEYKEEIIDDSDVELEEDEKEFIEVPLEADPEDEIKETVEEVKKETKEVLEAIEVESQPEEPTELQLAENYWGKTKGAFGGISEEEIIAHYNNEANRPLNPKLARKKNNQTT